MSRPSKSILRESPERPIPKRSAELRQFANPGGAAQHRRPPWREYHARRPAWHWCAARRRRRSGRRNAACRGGRPSRGDFQNFLDLPGGGNAVRPARNAPPVRTAFRAAHGRRRASRRRGCGILVQPAQHASRQWCASRRRQQRIDSACAARLPGDPVILAAPDSLVILAAPDSPVHGRPGQPGDIGRPGQPGDIGRPGHPATSADRPTGPRTTSRIFPVALRTANNGRIGARNILATSTTIGTTMANFDDWFDGNWWNNGLIDYPYVPNFGFWGWAAWGGLTDWVDYGWSDPVYYNYGENVYYDDGSVYYGDQPVAPKRSMPSKRRRSPRASPETPPAPKDWMPLGVFAVTSDGQPTGADPTMFLQLAVSKQGVINGTFQNTTTGSVQAIEGMVDMSRLPS